MERVVGILLVGVLMAAIIFLAAGLRVLKSGTRKAERVSKGAAYVDSWGSVPDDDSVKSVRVGGIGPGSFGKELRVRVLDRRGEGTLDALSWKIDSSISPDLPFKVPLAPDSIGAVLIAIE